MGKAASTNKASSLADPDDGFLTLMDEISSEIDHEYKPTQDTNANSPKPQNGRYQFPSGITSIRSINDLYTFHAQIGQGVSGSVFLAQSNKTYKQYALKSMPRSDALNLLSFISEINVLRSINHPNIVQFNDAYISQNDYFITTQYCSGGTLLDRIAKRKRFSERDCVDYMKKILEAVHYLHSRNIVHRDLKLGNIVFDNADINNSKLKLIDFGQSEIVTNMSKVDRNVVGSLPFLPPETTTHRTKRDLFAGDLWAIGIIAYILVEGAVPYKAKNVGSMMRCIRRVPLKWNNDIPISDACKDFIVSLLDKDITTRLNVEEALEHPWIVSKAKDDNLGDEYFSKLKQLNFQNKLQRIMVDAALNGMDETNKKLILSHDGYEDDNQLINQILSGITPPTVSSKTLKVPLQYTADISDKSLDDMNIDELLDEIDAESLMTESILSETQSPRSPRMNDTMSVERFVEILSSSPKKYDIPQIIANVSNDGSEPITFERIASYHGRIDSILL